MQAKKLVSTLFIIRKREQCKYHFQFHKNKKEKLGLEMIVFLKEKVNSILEVKKGVNQLWLRMKGTYASSTAQKESLQQKYFSSTFLSTFSFHFYYFFSPDLMQSHHTSMKGTSNELRCIALRKIECNVGEEDGFSLLLSPSAFHVSIIKMA